MPHPFRPVAAAAVATILFVIFVTGALAHPLGNFTINHYSRIETTAHQLRVRYVLDYAEIPTFQEKQAMDSDGNGDISAAERAAYVQTRLPALIAGLKLNVGGQPTALSVESSTSTLELVEGQSGLQIMRLAAWLSAPLALSDTGVPVHYQDDNYAERLGWREIVATANEGTVLDNASVPAVDTSRELTTYPQDLLNNPRNDRQADFRVTPGGAGAATSISPVVPGTLAALDRTRDEFAKLINSNQELSLSVLVVSFLAALALGAVHAFSPGHGKAVVGAYLVGSRGTWRHALFLGLVVTATHTAGVYALGFVTLFLSEFILPERLFPYLGLLSGLLVAVIGARLFVERLRGARARTSSYDRALALHARGGAGHIGPLTLVGVAGQPHTHGDGTVHSHADEAEHIHPVRAVGAHEYALALEATSERSAAKLLHKSPPAGGPGRSHDPGPSKDVREFHSHPGTRSHGHSHGFATPEEEEAHAHAHLAEIEKLDQPNWQNLLSLGISGGLLPCPSALVVMLSAIALGRVLYGFYLILGFSLGLASVLVLTGLTLLYAGKLAGRMFSGERVGWFFRYVPIAGAFFVAILGVAIALDSVFQTGLVR